MDGASIASPTRLHAANSIACAERGWHVLVEKPVTDSLRAADHLAFALQRYGVRSLVGHHRRHHPSVQRLKELVTNSIGTPLTATLIWAMRKPEGYFQNNWRTTGGSPVMINLVHDVDILRFVLGEITQIAGFASNAQRNTDRVESGALALKFANGVTGCVTFADTALSPWGFEAGTSENPNIATTAQDMIWITGTEGSVSFPSLTHWTGSRDWSEAPTPCAHAVERVVPLMAQLDHFLDVIDGKCAPLIDVADARQTLDTTLKIETLMRRDLPLPIRSAHTPEGAFS